jgi:hypothetical protein
MSLTAQVAVQSLDGLEGGTGLMKGRSFLFSSHKLEVSEGRCVGVGLEGRWQEDGSN